MKLKELLSHLHAANLNPVVLPTPNSGAVVILPHGARILGLFASTDSDNAYYTNPEFTSPAAVKTFFAGTHVMGGDRLWLAPERGLFFVGNKESDGVAVDPSIDPGHYIVSAQAERAITFVNHVDAPFHQVKNGRIRASVERTIRSIASPFKDAPSLLPALKNTHFAGYEVASLFTLHSAPADDLYFGMWFLIQLVTPHGGHVYVPTRSKAVITDYYEPTGADYLRVEDSHVRFKLDSIHRHKIGIRKIETHGQIAYLSDEHTGTARLVIRNFLNNPSAHYADVPLDNPAGTQDSIQSYNHFTGPTGFGEIEFHAPGISRAMGIAGDPVVTDTNQVWLFTGPRADLVAVASRLLGLPATAFAL